MGRKELKKRLMVLTLAIAVIASMTGCGEQKEKEFNSMQITELELPEGTVGESVTARNEYYVSPNGSDKNPGTKEEPFRTLYYARDVVRKMKDSVSGDITVYLYGGYYRLFKTLEFTEEDSGSEDGRIIYKAVEGEEPILSGGAEITRWERTSVNGIENVYKAKLQGFSHIRQFYAGDQAQPRAAHSKKLSWELKNVDGRDCIRVFNFDLSTLHDASQVEVMWPVEWKIFIMQAEFYSDRELYFDEPYFGNLVYQIENNTQGEAYYPNASTGCYLINDLSFLDEPGEWFYDEKTEELYYYPADGVDMEQTRFFVPVVEDVIHISGQVDDKISYVQFEGITFCHGAWNEPSEKGLIVNQAQNKLEISHNADSGWYTVGYSDYEANITVENADNLIFKYCTFRNMGSTALRLKTGVQNSVVQGCIFRETSDSALALSHSNASDASEQEQCINNIIDNNVFRQTGLDYWSAPAIIVYYAAKTQITHNDIYDVPYTGISLGWGWYFKPNSTVSRENVVVGNKIGKYMQKCRDGGGIYTLGQQPDSVIKENYIFDQAQAYAGLYHDEGSAYFTTTDNVVDNYNDPFNTSIFWLLMNGREDGPNGGKTVYQIQVRNNYHVNPNASLGGEPSSCDVSDNIQVTAGEWPAEAKAIMENAGLQEAYQFLLDKIN